MSEPRAFPRGDGIMSVFALALLWAERLRSPRDAHMSVFPLALLWAERLRFPRGAHMSVFALSLLWAERVTELLSAADPADLHAASGAAAEQDAA